MKTKILSAALLITVINWRSSIYDVQVEPVEGGNAISMSSYVNKKIVITVINAARPSVSQLLWLDSLQRANASLKIIAVPAIDLSDVVSDVSIAALKTGLSLDFVITRAANVKKSAGNNQHPLFKWLTHVSENAHFDRDVESTGQLFIVSRTGTLYSVLNDDVPVAMISRVLNQEIN